MSYYMSRKERIILTAIEIIDELGFQGLSTKEICRRQAISEGTLYKHFRSKDEVIIGVLEFYSKFDKDIKETIEMRKYPAKEAITYFISRFAEYYENDPAMAAILNSHEILRHEEGIAHKVTEIFESRSNYITQLIDRGKSAGEIKLEVDSESLSDIILGSCTVVALKWRMRNCSFPLKERILAANEHIMKSC